MYINQEEFGQRVKALRKEKGLSLQQVADDLNVSYQHYKKIENGSHGCSIGVLLDICSYFNVSADYMLTGRYFETFYIKKRLQNVQDNIVEILNTLK